MSLHFNVCLLDFDPLELTTTSRLLNLTTLRIVASQQSHMTYNM